MYRVKNKIILEDFEIEFIKNNFKNGVIWCARKLNLPKHKITEVIKNAGLFMSAEEKRRCRSALLTRSDDKCKVKIEKFLKLDDPNLIYFLGFFWADGTVRSDNSISFTIVKDDLLNIKHILDSIGDWRYYDVVRKNRKPKISARATNKLIKNWMIEHDFHIKSFAEPTKIISKIPESLLHYFFRGYLDGDGCISKGAGYQTTFSAPIDYSWGFMEKLCRNLDVREFSVERSIKKSGSTSIFVVCKKDSSLRLLQYIYKGYEIDKIGLDRKYNIFFNKMVKGVYKGENIWPVNNKFRLGVTLNGKLKHIGYFNSRKEAMVAYNDFVDQNNLYWIKQVYREGVTSDKHIRRTKDKNK